MTVATKLQNKLNEMEIEYFAEYGTFYINGKSLQTWDDYDMIALVDEEGDTIKEYKNATSAIKATFN